MNIIASFLTLQEKRNYYNYKCRFIFLFFTIILIQNVTSQTLAFPDANGFAKYATGGRGGSVIKVTNLNASGPGSLRAALEASGPRTVTFEVGGTIDLAGTNIYISNGNLTIAGQTAPGDGILIKGGQIQFETSNVICRYIRVRPGPSALPGYDGISINGDNKLVENIIIDHCSISWAGDENFNTRTIGSGIVRNITLQNSLLAECQYAFLNSEGRNYNITVYNNFFALNNDRHIRSQGSGYLGNTYFDFEMINNIVYGNAHNSNFSYGHKMSAINNNWKLSSQVTNNSTYLYKTLNEFGGVLADTDAYITGNIIPSGHVEYETELNPYITGTPYASSGITAIPAASLASTLLSHVGSSYPTRDAVDTRLVANFNNGDGIFATSGTYPTINGGSAPADTDNDGMPDFWEIDNGLDINDASDRNIVQADGYTNLEYYLNNLFFLNNEGVNANAGQDQNICEGQIATLTASGGDTYLWSTGETSQTITVSPNITTTYTVTAFVGNESDTDDVIITVNTSPTANAGNDISILEGDSTTLSASGGDTYLWSTGETTQNITVTPNTTTTYTVTAFLNGCEDTDDVVVTVNTQVVADAGEDVTICENTSTTLTASGGTNYLWSTGETTQSIVVSPNTTTTYSVTVSSGNNSDTDDVVVNVNPNPIANAGSDITISQGENTTLTASGGDSYVWSTGETTQSITVSPTSTTTYTVIAILNGCEDTDDVVVTVETEQVIADAGADVDICQGDGITLTASGGTDYLWSTGETTQSITVSPSSTTNYTVIVSNENSSDTDDVTVVVNPVPNVTVTDDTTILEGNYITLSASGADTYEWSNGAIQPNIAVSPSVTTTYFVTGYINNCYDIKDVTVSVVEQVVVDAGDDTSICLGDEITLTANASGAESYLWNTGETSQSISVSPNVDTMYTVIASNSLDSEADDIMVNVNICEEEEIIPDDEEFTFTAYIDSRVSEDILKVKLTGLKNQCALYLFDISGKLIHTDEFDGNDGQEVIRTINTSQISDGVYIIKVIDNNNVHPKSIVIR
jgi:hypothetical protein